jgi:hypothetical protein
MPSLSSSESHFNGLPRPTDVLDAIDTADGERESHRRTLKRAPRGRRRSPETELNVAVTFPTEMIHATPAHESHYPQKWLKIANETAMNHPLKNAN